MKPYQIFSCRKLPLEILKRKKHIKNSVQMTLYGGESEQIETIIKLLSASEL